MNTGLWVSFLIISVFAAIGTAGVHAVGHNVQTSTNAAGENHDSKHDSTVVVPVSMLRRGLAAATWTPVWWERIKNSYKGNDLKLCPMRSAPAKGSWCGKNKTTCFFGNKTCPTVGANPTVKCFCNGTSTKTGKWSCSPEKCPTSTTPAPTPTPTLAGIFRSVPGRAFDVRLNLVTPKILQGYDTIADLAVDLEQALRFDVNYVVETSTTRFPSFARNLPAEASSSAFKDISSPRSSVGSIDFHPNDKSDLVTSNGIHIFAVYGTDSVIVSNAATGKLVANYTLPNVDKNGIIQGMSLVGDRLVLFVEKGTSTRVIVLNISKLPCCITVVTRNDIRGKFRDARMTGNNIHLVTWSKLGIEIFESIERYKPAFNGMNNFEYKKAAAKIAEPLIANVVADLKNGISVNGKPPKMTKITLWQTDIGDSGSLIEKIHGLLGSYVQVTSFSVKQGFTGSLTLSKAVAFVPSFKPIWAIDGNLLLAVDGWNWKPQLRGVRDRTYLLGFKLNGASATPSYLGSVDGTVYDLERKYSLSVYKGHLNLATTEDSLYPVGNGNINGFPRPTTVRVLKIPTGNELVMMEVTRITGFDDYYFSFFKNICYAVQSSVLSAVLDLNPAGAKVLSRNQQIKRFMEIHIDDTLLVTANRPLLYFGGRFEFTVYDARVPTKLTQVQNYVLGTDAWPDSSGGNWDFDRSSWLSLGDGVGMLVIPLRVIDETGKNPNGNFDGYMVYEISLTAGVYRHFNVSHVESKKYNNCYEDKQLAERLIVNNGTMTTTKGHSILSTNLKTGRNRWKLEITNSSKLKCCFDWIAPPDSVCRG